MVLAQLSHPLNDRNPYFCNKENVPLAAGYLRAMARSRGLDEACDISILEPALADRAGDAAIVTALAERETDVLAVSLYPWSVARTLHIAGDLRRLRPELLVVAGGPEVNGATVEHLLASRQVDVAVPGEGEVTFCDLLEAWLLGSPIAHVAGVVVLEDGAVVRAPLRATLADLDLIPSPYLEGDIDVRAYESVHVLFERGCIYSCKFCHWWPDRRSRGRFSIARLSAELAFLRAAGTRQVVLLDASINTSRHFEEICTALALANADGRMEVKVQVLFDHLTRDQVERLARGGVRKLEIGLQSSSAEVLKRARRPTDLDRFAHAVTLVDGLAVELQVDFIIGLPGDTPATVAATAELVREVGKTGRLAQVSPFVLSVGSASALRLEAESIGLRFQPEAPHRVLATAELPYALLRELRMRVPELLGQKEHPFFEYNRPHYALNFFEPELAWQSGPEPEPDAGAPAGRDTGGLVAGVRVTCAGGREGHAHPLAASLLRARLAQVATLWIETPDPGACRAHACRFLEEVTTANPYGVWDLVLETGGPFALPHLAALIAAVRFRVNNLDWDNYLVNPVEGSGFARLALRPLVILPLGSAPAGWLEQASRAAVLVHALRIAREEDAERLLGLAERLPGEGVLVELAPGSAPGVVKATLERLLASPLRITALRDVAQKALLEQERARRAGGHRPRVPWSDRELLLTGRGGGPVPRTITRKRALRDAAQLALELGTASVLRGGAAVARAATG